MSVKFPSLVQFSKVFRPLAHFHKLLKNYFSIEECVDDILYMEITRLNKFLDDEEVRALHFGVGPAVIAFIDEIHRNHGYWKSFAGLIYDYIHWPMVSGITMQFPVPVKVMMNERWLETADAAVLLVLLRLSRGYDEIEIALKIK